jgi:hypothetical protein
LHSNAGNRVPHTPDWLHEIKYDGYRLRLERDDDRVRLITRNRARSAPTCFGRPATWGWKVWYRSAETGPIVLAGRHIG